MDRKQVVIDKTITKPKQRNSCRTIPVNHCNHCAIECVLKSDLASHFTRDAHWFPNHKTFFLSFALPYLWKVIIHFLIWCRLSWNGRIGQSLTGIIRFHRHSRKNRKNILGLVGQCASLAKFKEFSVLENVIYWS